VQIWRGGAFVTGLGHAVQSRDTAAAS
jgi:hypothetical protein